MPEVRPESLLVKVLNHLSTSRAAVAREVMEMPDVNSWWLDHKRKDVVNARKQLIASIYTAEQRVEGLKGTMRQIGQLGGVAGAPLLASIHTAEQTLEKLRKELASL